MSGQRDVRSCNSPDSSTKNGKEIYEGDILQDSPTYKGVCKYSCEKACFYIDRNEFGTGGKGYLNSEMEILGNIYENGELLKEGR